MKKDCYETPRWVVLIAVKLASLSTQTQEDIVEAIEYDLLYANEKAVKDKWEDIYYQELIRLAVNT